MKKKIFRKSKLNKINIPNENFTEYTEQSDTSNIKTQLNKNIRRIKLKIFLLIIYLAAYIALSFVFKTSLLLFNFKITNQIYLISSICLLALSLLTCSSCISNGLFALFELKINIDTVLTFAIIIAFIRSFVLLIFHDKFTLNLNTYVGIVILGMLFNTTFQLLIKKRIKRNFKFILSPKQKYKIDLYTKDDIPSEILSIADLQDPTMAFRHKTKFIENFFANSYSLSYWDKIITKISPIYILLSIVIGIVSFVFTRDLIYCFTSMLISLLISFPISLFMCLNSHLNTACKMVLKKGAMITNFETIKKFSSVNSIFLDASMLYPSNNVILKEIKTFRGQRVDEAILSAAALVSSKKGTLTDVFNKIIMGEKNLLTKASDVIYEDEKGITGWVNGKRTIIGNRQLLKEHGVDPPSRDYENKYRKDGEGLTYIAIGQELVAMFILEYKPNRKLQSELLTAEKNKIKVFIKTSDSNINTERIIKDFKLSFDNIKMLSYEESLDLKNIEEENTFKSNSDLATIGGYESVLNSVCVCKKVNTNFLLILAIQVASLILSISIVICLSVFFTLDRIGEIEIFIYVLFWALALLITPKIKLI
ncbi:MAG: hypothetical protein RUMPE_00303 [Eubacteriales bacterium SKADARSKE-1]|nr:hypothetical protein [Eubacteriales bacterium SKADARSKE-1]